MKILTRVFGLVILMFAFSAFYVRAEDALKAGAIKSCGTPQDVSVEAVPAQYCDIYQRQLMYREKAKSFRGMLEQRRITYETAHFDVLEKNRSQVEEIYRKESEDFQASLADDNEAGKKAKSDKENPEDGRKDNTADVAKTPSADGTVQEETGLKERDYPPEKNEDGDVVKKRVIMPEDAPDFDAKPF